MTNRYKQNYLYSNQPMAAQTNKQENLFIYHLKLTSKYHDLANWTAETQAIIQEHAQFLDDLGKQGILVFAGRTKLNPGDENLFGIAIIKAANIELAKKTMAKDPAVVHKIQKATIFPFSMGIRYLNNLE